MWEPSSRLIRKIWHQLVGYQHLRTVLVVTTVVGLSIKPARELSHRDLFLLRKLRRRQRGTGQVCVGVNMFCCCQDAGGVQCLESISVFFCACNCRSVCRIDLWQSVLCHMHLWRILKSRALENRRHADIMGVQRCQDSDMLQRKPCYAWKPAEIPALRHLQLQQQNRATAQAKRTFSLLSHTPANRNKCPCCKHFLTIPANTSILSLSLKNQNFKFVALTRVPSQPVALCFPISYLLNLNAVLTAGDSSRPSPDGSSDGPKAFANGFRLVWVSPSYRPHAA